MGDFARVRTDGSAQWDSPGVFRVAEDVFRIPLPLPQDGLRAVNVYVLADDGGLTLIDSGWDIPEARDRLRWGIERIGSAMTDIRSVVVTHFHRDHYELALGIRREFGAHVALGAGERPAVELMVHDQVKPLGPQADYLAVLGARALGDRVVERGIRDGLGALLHEAPDSWIGDRQQMGTRRSLLALATPGHTRGHVVFHDEKASLLFTGDHVLPDITPSIGFEAILSENPLGDFMASLKLIRSRPDAALLPAHGPVTDSVHRRVEELLAHHERRLDQTEAALLEGARTGLEVATRLKWRKSERPFAELDDFDQMLAVSETGAHAQLLVALGRADAEMHAGTIHYSPRRGDSPVPAEV